VLIDGGPPDAGDTVADFIATHLNGHVNLIIGSHLDLDHIGGLIKIVNRCTFNHFHLNLPPDTRRFLGEIVIQKATGKKTGALWDRVEKSLDTAVALLEALQKKHVVPKPINAGDYLDLGEIRLNILNPTPERLVEAWNEIEGEEGLFKSTIRALSEAMGEAPETSAENNSSVVIEMIYKGSPYALMTADAGADVLREVINGKQYPFLKVPHHGSKTGLDDHLVSTIKPRIACVPVGPNSYGHPAEEILDLLHECGAAIYCSEKVEDCPEECLPISRRNICFPKDRPLRPGWIGAPFCS
jgi:beta-lactamase superfamily II metal-dependent hydrolase